MEALEVIDDPHQGYCFAILGDFEADPWELFQRLYANVRRRISTRHVHRTEFGWQLTSEQRLVGRIERDPNWSSRISLTSARSSRFAAGQIERWGTLNGPATPAPPLPIVSAADRYRSGEAAPEARHARRAAGMAH
jgi:hypothetical protein